METQIPQHDFQNKLDRYFSREFQVVIKVVALLSVFYTMVLVPLNAMKQEIEYIKTNHLAHIEAAIDEIRQEEESEKGKNNARDIQLQRIITMLEEHEKATKTAP